jgi:hypothetical protein
VGRSALVRALRCAPREARSYAASLSTIEELRAVLAEAAAPPPGAARDWAEPQPSSTHGDVVPSPPPPPPPPVGGAGSVVSPLLELARASCCSQLELRVPAARLLLGGAPQPPPPLPPAPCAAGLGSAMCRCRPYRHGRGGLGSADGEWAQWGVPGREGPGTAPAGEPRLHAGAGGGGGETAGRGAPRPRQSAAPPWGEVARAAGGAGGAGRRRGQGAALHRVRGRDRARRRRGTSGERLHLHRHGAPPAPPVDRIGPIGCAGRLAVRVWVKIMGLIIIRTD